MAVDNVARALAAKAIAGGGAGSSSGSGVQVQADWNINDESNPSFIKNKPFGGDDPVVIFRKDSLDEYGGNTIGPNSEYIPLIYFDLGQNELTLVDGETYHVKCSSDQGTVEYTGKAKYVLDVTGVFILGDCISEDGSPDPDFNVAIIVGETYDESSPPNIAIQFRNLAVSTQDAVPTLTNVSIIIEKGAIKKIPSKFIELPDIHIPEQVQSDWNTADESDPSFIKNKPTMPEQVQADWNDNDNTSPSFIKNKPNILTVYMVYKSKYDNGDYNADGSITGKPIYEALLNGSAVYYVDDSISYANTYYPMTSIHILQVCNSNEFSIACAYISFGYNANKTSYTSIENKLHMSFKKTETNEFII